MFRSKILLPFSRSKNNKIIKDLTGSITQRLQFISLENEQTELLRVVNGVVEHVVRFTGRER
jgi:hypothetical protein